MSRQSERYIQEINEKMEIVQHKGLNCSVESCGVLPLTFHGRVLVNFTNCLFPKHTFFTLFQTVRDTCPWNYDTKLSDLGVQERSYVSLEMLENLSWGLYCAGK